MPRRENHFYIKYLHYMHLYNLCIRRVLHQNDIIIIIIIVIVIIIIIHRVYDTTQNVK
jgi:hypothetical protein